MMHMRSLRDPQQNVAVSQKRGGHLATVVAVNGFALHVLVGQDDGVAGMALRPCLKILTALLK